MWFVVYGCIYIYICVFSLFAAAWVGLPVVLRRCLTWKSQGLGSEEASGLKSLLVAVPIRAFPATGPPHPPKRPDGGQARWRNHSSAGPTVYRLTRKTLGLGRGGPVVAGPVGRVSPTAPSLLPPRLPRRSRYVRRPWLPRRSEAPELLPPAQPAHGWAWGGGAFPGPTWPSIRCRR